MEKIIDIMKIGNKKIGIGSPTYIIAEAGINHNGDMEIAKHMIEQASRMGVDAIKFQTLLPDELFSKKLNPELFELIKQWSFSKQDHLILKKYAEKHNLDFISTPIGKKTANILHEIKCTSIKLSSADLTNFELLKHISSFNIPLIVSTGMSTMSEIYSTVEFLSKQNSSFCLLHCTAAYPTPVDEANLVNISYFKKIFSIPIGYSDHTLGNDACCTAVSLGATVIEKHFTLDKNMDGPDQKLSADITDFKNLVTRIRKIERLMGEQRIMPTTSEVKFRRSMRRSLVFAKDIKKDVKLKKSDFVFLRPGNGISINNLDFFVGLKINQNVTKGSFLRRDMI
jgi:N,N'-diacetyllegionaminate synthase